MKIISFEVAGLFGKSTPIKLVFNTDLNIITGRNGSGKTSVLKLLWYILSGNILPALKEVNFKRATLITTDYECTVHKLDEYHCKVDWKMDGKSFSFADEVDDEFNVYRNAEDLANELLRGIGSSVFLPTFRRIEGGFTSNERKASSPVSRARGEIEEALVALSKRLTNQKHVFVASLSTVDVVTLLIRHYTNLSAQYNLLQTETSQTIIGKIKAFKRGDDHSKDVSADKMLDEIKTTVEGMEGEREGIMRPFEAVRELAMKIFKHSGITLTKDFSFGDAANAINSDALSAGEKQMLSFIAYNAFNDNAVMVIDEPELSLHVDWQRQLFPILLGQQASNQFVIATHSPFIYSKYSDKEIQLDPIRGDEFEEAAETEERNLF